MRITASAFLKKSFLIRKIQIMTIQNGSSKAWNIALWALQVVLAALFLMPGIMKTTTPIEELISMGMTWAEGMPILPRIIGVSEMLGSVGLILPAVLRIKPVLTVWAAIGLAVVMALAVIVHLATNDAAHSGMPLMLGAAAVFVAWGRSKKSPIMPKTQG